MIEFLNTNKLFSADDRTQLNGGLKLANSITIEDLIENGRKAEENNTIDPLLDIINLQKDIINTLYGGPLP